MKKMIFRRLLLIFSAAIFMWMFNQISALKSSDLLVKADNAYQQLHFANASALYNQYISLASDSIAREVYEKLFNCYWQMREFRLSKNIMKQMVEKFPNEITNADKIRFSELAARDADYKAAALWLKNVEGYNKKTEFYENVKGIDELKSDSVDWNINFLNINTPYREFSPFIFGDNLLFTTNMPPKGIKKTYGWDNDGFSELMVVPLDKIKNTSDELISEKSKRNIVLTKTRKQAGVFEDSDVKPLQSVASMKDEVPELSGDSLISFKKTLKIPLDYNAGVASVDDQGEIYFTANEQNSRQKFFSNENLKHILSSSTLNINTSRQQLMYGKLTQDNIYHIKPVFEHADSLISSMHPAVNNQGNILVFSKINSKNGYDLYVSVRSENRDVWGAPVLLPNNVNTIGNEVFPTIGKDGFLYFSSDGRPGFGGLDIYKIKLDEAMNGSGTPQLLGYPVNSPADDFGFMPDSTAVNGFFTSDRLADNDNIYTFDYKPVPRITHISGLVVEKKTKKIMAGATVFLYDKPNGKVYVDKTDDNGRYKFDVLKPGDYVLKAVESNCIDDCLSMLINEMKVKDKVIDAPRDLMLELQYQNVWVLNNLLYDFDKWNIRKDARPPLDSLVTILKTYPISVELGSHTDSRGSFKYNERLSQKRAESAVAYIVNKGIDPKRITAKGYGESKLKNKCADGVPCTEEEHQQNRRTEITVTYNPKPANSIDPSLYKKGDVLQPSVLPNNFFDNCK